MKSLSRLSIILCLPFTAGGLPPGVKNSQKPGDRPPTPLESLKKFQLPPGYEVTLFAGDPDVAQPIATAFDGRGRLWVAECYTYPNWLKDHAKGRDRILIFEDTDRDGRFEKRTVFQDGLANLTGLEIGHGGVYVLTAPHLRFIPDRDRDDRPDGDGDILIEGFTLKAKHNIVNGLKWGPDGWLYGRHGITHPSVVNRPGSQDKVKLDCSVWRFHPVGKQFEVVAWGTTNPWGLDWNDHGEAFTTNCVIGHLWHIVPNAHYKRMFGSDLNPHVYELLPQTADHLHWSGAHWTDSRNIVGPQDDLGGGHAHSGGIVYLGDGFPGECRGNVFMGSVHGRRLNQDIPERKGCGYVGRHGQDMFKTPDEWYRASTLDYGPEGAIYVADWCDLGECHDHDGVHRESGRIYRFTYGRREPLPAFDLHHKTDAELVKLQRHKNDWWVRQARRVLAERASAGKPMKATHAALRKMLAANPDMTRKLRALWALHVTGGAPEALLLTLLSHPEEHVRVWAVRLLTDDKSLSPAAESRLIEAAKIEQSGLARLHLASAMRRMTPAGRVATARNLSQHAEDAADPWQPLMVWYGVEPAVTAVPAADILAVTRDTKLPKLRRFIARRLASELRLADTLALATEVPPAARLELLRGVRDGLRGRKSVPPPKNWAAARDGMELTDWRARHLMFELGLTFGDAATADLMKQTLTSEAAAELRRATLKTLAARRVEGVRPLVVKLLDGGTMRGPAIRALAAYPGRDTSELILSRYEKLTDAEKRDAVTTLAARPRTASSLLKALAAGRVPRRDVSPFVARQVTKYGPTYARRVEETWGLSRRPSGQKKRLIARYQKRLTDDIVAGANVTNGRAVFRRMCVQCHTLHGEGQKVGPDLTGSDRRNLYYVLSNLFDPSGEVSWAYRVTNVFTADGRLVSGLVLEETDQAVTLRTAEEAVTIDKADILKREKSNVSMMPEGQVDQMSFAELRDLIAYLRK